MTYQLLCIMIHWIYVHRSYSITLVFQLSSSSIFNAIFLMRTGQLQSCWIAFAPDCDRYAQTYTLRYLILRISYIICPWSCPTHLHTVSWCIIPLHINMSGQEYEGFESLLHWKLCVARQHCKQHKGARFGKSPYLSRKWPIAKHCKTSPLEGFASCQNLSSLSTQWRMSAASVA
jgi:hypothetical protein